MSLFFDSIYKPVFVWDNEDGEVAKSASKHKFGEVWGEDLPAMLLSDSEDDTSIPERPARRKFPLHHGPRHGGRHVHFSAARIREHAVILGDLACCSCLPLSLDWNHGKERIYDIDDYETMRRRCGREERGKLPRLGLEERRRILEEAELAAQCEYTAESDEDSMEPDDDPITVLGTDGFSVNIEPPVDNPPTCDPFAVFHGSGWGAIFGDHVCGYPAMTVQVLED